MRGSYRRTSGRKRREKWAIVATTWLVRIPEAEQACCHLVRVGQVNHSAVDEGLEAEGRVVTVNAQAFASRTLDEQPGRRCPRGTEYMPK